MTSLLGPFPPFPFAALLHVRHVNPVNCISKLPCLLSPFRFFQSCAPLSVISDPRSTHDLNFLIFLLGRHLDD